MFWQRNRKLENIRKLWGKVLDKHRNFDLISSYFKLQNNPDKQKLVDDKTWDDLNLNSVFSLLDRNISGVGQQFLYSLLRKYNNGKDDLIRRSKIVEELKTNSELREKIQLKLLNVSGVSSYFISYLLLSKNLPQFKFYKMFYILSLASLISLLLISYNGIFLIIALGFLLTNLIISRIFSSKIYEYFAGFSGINNLLLSSLSICEIKTNSKIEELEYLKSKKSLMKSLKSKLGYLVIDKQYLGELALTFIEYLNMFMLFDIIAYYRSVNVLMKHQYEIHGIFKAVGSLDASISVASYLEEVRDYCLPEFNTENKVSFDELYHPLLQDPISNSLKDITRSVLITGSNMSGKTTFIKTLGVNFILARTLNFCLAKSVSIPNLIVKTSIRRNEEFEEGKSYFFIEIEAIKDFIELSNKEDKYLILIDEIFRGTNTIERLSSSASVLKYLEKENFVFVTTHDIELQEMLQNSYLMYHFSEKIKDDNFYFNYKIKPGACKSGNAIKLLELMNYPKIITDEAYLISLKLNQKL
jgi:DNA mismatch repair ATPase MutS